MNRCIRPVCVLIFLDQMIKIFLRVFFFQKPLLFPGHLIGLYPAINEYLSLAGNFIPFLRSPVLIIIINFIAIAFCITAYHFQQFHYKKQSKWAERTFILGISGCLCSLIDKLFWGGSLDYVLVLETVLFDLKDVYIIIALTLLIVFLIRNSETLTWHELTLFFRYSKKNS